MKIILSLLAAIAAICLVVPSAQAQSSQTVQLKRMDTGLASVVQPDGIVGFAADNNNDFRQRFLKEKVGTNVFRFVAAISNQCIRVPDGLSSNDSATMKLGSCSGPRAQWRETSFGGGKLYQNPSTGHYLLPSFCFGLCAESISVTPKYLIDPWGGLSIARWKLDVLF